MKSFELGQKVNYFRMDNSTGLPVMGEGVVVGKVIGVAQRINYQVKQDGKAYNIEPEAIDCTDEEKAAYLAHYGRVNEFIAEFTKTNEAAVAEANKTIDNMHTEFFGAKVDIDEPAEVVTEKAA